MQPVTPPPMGQKILGIDVGSKTLGLALSDRSHTIASHAHTIQRGKWAVDLAEIKKLIAVERVGMIVLGMPLNMDGTPGASAQAVKTMASNLRRDGDLAGIPVEFWDERLSTAAVERELIAQDMSRQKRAEQIDARAAAYILQGFLDYWRNRNMPQNGD
jgi:putative Holliday junction resolvase